MLKLSFSICLVTFCLSVRQVSCSKKNVNDLEGFDLFQAAGIDTYSLQNHLEQRRSGRAPPLYKPSEMDKLNDLLVDGTDSKDPHKNFDIVVDSLISDYKNKVPTDSLPVKAKRLFAALSTIKGDNQCDYYSYQILKKNFEAINTDIQLIREKRTSRRIDKVLEYFIYDHVEKCQQTYYAKFNELASDLDERLMKRLDLLLGQAIKKLTSDESQDNEGKSYAERLFSVATRKTSHDFKLKPSYIYNSIKDLAESEMGILLSPVENERTGRLEVGQRNLERVFDGMVAKPCEYFRDRFGSDVIESVLFDSQFGHQVESSRVEFYEALVKYKLCYLDGSVEKLAEEFIEYGRDGIE